MERDEYSAEDLRVIEVLEAKERGLTRLLDAIEKAKPDPRSKDYAVRKHRPKKKRSPR